MSTVLYRQPDIECDCAMHPEALEARDHLRNARECLERLSIDESSPAHGADFPHFEDATRSIHGALLALEACSWVRAAPVRPR